MIPVDRVYQKVLALLNKEQRGYLTPQEFNLLADKAQKEIFESYFAQPKEKLYKNTSDDHLDTISEKLQEHKINQGSSAGVMTLTDAIYKIEHVSYVNTDNIRRIATEVSEAESVAIITNPLTQPVSTNRVYAITAQNVVSIIPNDASLVSMRVDGWSMPSSPNWAYVVVNDKALFNLNAAVDFDLHQSEEEYLVNRILELAGVIVQKPGLIEIAKSDRMVMKQEQNS
jgi:hypothetical protein